MSSMKRRMSIVNARSQFSQPGTSGSVAEAPVKKSSIMPISFYEGGLANDGTKKV